MPLRRTFWRDRSCIEGSYKEADRFVDELKRVTPEEVQRVARKYMKGFRFAYVGDPSKLNARTFSLF